ncbi:uncharacterized protein NEMAJ01_1779 [Nematocida major]|uniref:uncharacterized protein n=1 Tax=Nematocida major TaxID=1912982 RepID=UPI00200867AA|nr:uncharacterized protein NEMAJ01_1779 [Nematocida major]KAH9386883.1 hypothetical protein NEMAJ01_1779 [Nematocida major]
MEKDCIKIDQEKLKKLEAKLAEGLQDLAAVGSVFDGSVNEISKMLKSLDMDFLAEQSTEEFKEIVQFGIDEGLLSIGSNIGNKSKQETEAIQIAVTQAVLAKVTKNIRENLKKCFLIGGAIQRDLKKSIKSKLEAGAPVVKSKRAAQIKEALHENQATISKTFRGIVEFCVEKVNELDYYAILDNQLNKQESLQQEEKNLPKKRGKAAKRSSASRGANGRSNARFRSRVWIILVVALLLLIVISYTFLYTYMYPNTAFALAVKGFMKSLKHLINQENTS